ncbi:MAG: SIS domain-containing protein [Candidatus Eremiobacteraeota bacterium]|nr:SIS domain-containing protein [Candidatus Eremiobacteraeota bacterium]
MATLGANFEREIKEQPGVWERLAGSDKAHELAAALQDDIVLVGSGSSLCVAELGALALRRRGIRAQAIAATEARLDHCAYEDKTVLAVSQSGASSDLFEALALLRPSRLIAVTNSRSSELAARAHCAIDVGAGPELAVPASKSVTASVALLLWSASILGAHPDRDASTLRDTAASVREWFGGMGATVGVAQAIAARPNVAVLGSDYGLPVARETALKLKEASYLHAEAFAAGEFRHGSVAMVDASFSVIGLVDRDALAIVSRPLRELQASGALRVVIGTCDVEAAERLGPAVDESFNTLAWLVTAQLISLHAARARAIECDAPRGLRKSLVAE